MSTNFAGITQAVIPAAGFGTRLRPLTNAIPKELLPVGRKTVLGHVLTELRHAGVTRALFIVSERKPQIRWAFGDEIEDEEDLPPFTCDYITQTEMRGSGDAVLRAEEWTNGKPFIVAFGDCFIASGDEGAAPLRRLIATHRKENAAATVLVEKIPRENVEKYGVVAPLNPLPDAPTESFALRDIVEKPTPQDAPSEMVVAARFAFEPAIFDALRRTPPDPRGEQNLPDAMRLLKREGASLWAAPLHMDEARKDIGSLESFFVAFVQAALNDPEAGAAVRRAIRDNGE